ncbi:MAG: thermonuclease family protein [Pseudomonadota bacterium]
MFDFRFLICCLVVIFWAPTAYADTALSGKAAVIDGNTLEIEGRQVRLLGIDAPEAAQELQLTTGGTDFLGRGAAMMLRSLITENSIRCQLSTQKDGRGLPLATCFNDTVDVAAEMIASGMARTSASYLSPYAGVETKAKANKKGFWRDQSEAPWSFRERRLEASKKSAARDCVFKAISHRGRKTLITPWSPWYNDVQVNLARGDRWFCNEAQAVSQGWLEPAWLIESVVSGVYNPTN